jgi:hypothetical protein
MPIEDQEELRIVEMGHGDVAVISGHLRDDPSIGTVSFSDGHGTHPINVPLADPKKFGETDIEQGARVRLEFGCIESVDAVIGELQNVRRNMEARK